MHLCLWSAAVTATAFGTWIEPCARIHFRDGFLKAFFVDDDGIEAYHAVSIGLGSQVYLQCQRWRTPNDLMEGLVRVQKRAAGDQPDDAQ